MLVGLLGLPMLARCTQGFRAAQRRFVPVRQEPLQLLHQAECVRSVPCLLLGEGKIEQCWRPCIAERDRLAERGQGLLGAMVGELHHAAHHKCLGIGVLRLTGRFQECECAGGVAGLQ